MFYRPILVLPFMTYRCSRPYITNRTRKLARFLITPQAFLGQNCIRFSEMHIFLNRTTLCVGINYALQYSHMSFWSYPYNIFLNSSTPVIETIRNRNIQRHLRSIDPLLFYRSWPIDVVISIQLIVLAKSCDFWLLHERLWERIAYDFQICIFF